MSVKGDNVLNNPNSKLICTLAPASIISESKLHQAKLSEVAVSVNINGISQAVMMVSPQHLKDFALGFSLSEGLLLSSSDVLDIVIYSHEFGWQVDLQVLARAHHRLKQRRRTMAGPSGCGLCGLDSIEEAMSLTIPSNKVKNKKVELPSEETIIQAKEALPSLLQMAGSTRGNHCAAFFDLSAKLIALREDVGRHSALDKLLGCLSITNQTATAGFALITSRCSHDLIAKAARLSLTTLVTLAQPTDLAVSSARKTGLTLFCFQHGRLKRYA